VKRFIKDFFVNCISRCYKLKNTRMLTPSEMKDRMLELARNEGYIDSIFNYCDRWCERCSFTSKCRNFAMSEYEPSTNGPELWEYLDTVFKATMLMLKESMEKMGIDSDEIAKMEPTEDPDPKEHPLYKKVHELSFSMHDWLKKNKPGEITSEQIEIISAEEIKNPRFKESLEVIYWYNFFISAKIFRALIENDNKDEIQNDSNGSAKIAMIALDRLIASWSVVMENMMNHQDEILKFLISLADVRKHAESTFPNARKFVRPGFDQE
jgi:hypothetical protein